MPSSKPPQPDAAQYRFESDPEYLRRQYEASGLSQRECARRLGVTHSTFKNWMAGNARWPYTAQFALECLSRAAADAK